MPSNTALIVGASRGLGLGLARAFLARGWQVIATERASRPSAELRTLAAESAGELSVASVDITLPREVEALRDRLSGTALGLLFVNAGVTNDPKQPIGAVSDAEWSRVLNTNALSPMRVIEALDVLVTGAGTIAVMSSGLASVANNTGGGWEAYRASKAALNTLLRSYGARSGGKRTLLAIAPGWVRTDMGGPHAALDIETSTQGIAEMIIARAGRGGVAFLDYKGNTVPW